MKVTKTPDERGIFIGWACRAISELDLSIAIFVLSVNLDSNKKNERNKK